MPPDGTVLADLPAAEADRPDRLDRTRIIAFVGNQETEAALREGLLEAVPQGFEIRRGTVHAAIAALQKMPTPHTLIVDVSGEDQPLSALGELSSVVEPDVRVLVIGDREDLNFCLVRRICGRRWVPAVCQAHDTRRFPLCERCGSHRIFGSSVWPCC